MCAPTFLVFIQVKAHVEEERIQTRDPGWSGLSGMLG